MQHAPHSQQDEIQQSSLRTQRLPRQSAEVSANAEYVMSFAHAAKLTSRDDLDGVRPCPLSRLAPLSQGRSVHVVQAILLCLQLFQDTSKT